MNKNKVDIAIAEYKKFIDDTVMYVEHHEGTPLELAYLGLGLAGEAGECADLIKKAIRNGVESFDADLIKLTPRLIDELGDVLWYYMNLLRFLNIGLDEVIDVNIVKLQKRMEKENLGALMRDNW